MSISCTSGISFNSIGNFFTCTIPNKIQSATNCIWDTLTYANPISKKREIILIPCWVDIFWGRLFSQGNLLPATNEMSKTIEKIGNFLIQNGELSSFNNFHFKFFVIHSEKVNAYSAPGGKIYITDTLINQLHAYCEEKNNLENISFEDGIAFVLGHEIAHAVSRHSVKETQTELATIGLAVLTGYSIHLIAECLFDLFLTFFLKVTLAPFSFILILDILLVFLIKISIIDPYNLIDCFFAKISQSYEFEADKLGMLLVHKACNTLDNSNLLKTLKLNQNSAYAGCWVPDFFTQQTSLRESASNHWAEQFADEITKLLSYLFDSHPENKLRAKENQKTWEKIRPVA